MEEIRQIKINTPEGWEIDKEKSTFENIVLKKKDEIKRWEDLKEITGYYIDESSTVKNITHEMFGTFHYNKHIFLTEKQAQSALASSQITQLLPYYGGYTELRPGKRNFCPVYKTNDATFGRGIDFYVVSSLFYFESKERLDEFIAINGDLLKQYFMID